MQTHRTRWSQRKDSLKIQIKLYKVTILLSCKVDWLIYNFKKGLFFFFFFFLSLKSWKP